MARIARKFQESPSARYHGMDRGHQREAVVADVEDRRYFLDLLGRYRRRFALKLFHDCVMTNDFQLLVRTETSKPYQQ